MNATDAIKQPLAQSVTPRSGQLGFWMCTALVVGNTIGIGIFMQPASLAPYGLNALIAWAITVFGTVVLALVFALLARHLARADGPFEYMRTTLGGFTAFVAIWCYWVSCWVTNATLATGVIGYLQAALPGFAGISPPVLVLVSDALPNSTSSFRPGWEAVPLKLPMMVCAESKVCGARECVTAKSLSKTPPSVKGMTIPPT